MKHTDDMEHSLAVEIASELYIRTPLGHIPELPETGLKVSWEHTGPEARDVFRARARRFMAGELSMKPWRFVVHRPVRVNWASLRVSVEACVDRPCLIGNRCTQCHNARLVLA